MASVVEALASAGALDKATIADEIRKLEQKTTEARIEIGQLVEDQFANFVPDMLGRDLKQLIEQFNTDIDQDTRRIQSQLHANDRAPNVSKAQLDKIREQLSETEAGLSSLSCLSSIADAFQELDYISPKDLPLRYAQLINGAKERLKQLQNASPESDGQKLFVDDRVLPALQEQLVMQSESLIYELVEWWAELFRWDTNKQQHSLAVQLAVTEVPAACDKLAALDLMNYLDQKVNHFAKNIDTYLLQPIFTHSQLEVSQKQASLVDSRSRKLCLKLGNTDSRPPAQDVFWNIERLLDAFDEMFGSLAVGDSESEKKGRGLIGLIGERLAQTLMENIIDKCIKPAVPFDNSGTAEFEQIVDAANALEARLKEIGFLPASMSSFETFSQNYDTLFMDRRCQKILSDGRNLIKAEIHNLVEVGIEKSGKESLTDLETNFENIYSPSELSQEQLMQQSIAQINEATQKRLPKLFLFPKCMISSSLVSFVKLLESSLDEASNCTEPKAAGRLLETSRNLVELYVDLTPLQHEHKIRSIPQLAAVFYNNCYYLSHRLMTLGWEISPRLGPMIGLSATTVRITFLDFVPRLREMANECLEVQINERRKEIDACLDDRNLFTDLNEQKNKEKCERSVRMCTMQMEQLGNVWKEVMTPTVLFKSLGVLSAHLLNSLVYKILQIEDVAASDATDLANIIGLTLKQLENLFKVDKEKKLSEIRRFCETPYYRCQELILCLQGSLQEIGDRWCEGKGPLSMWMNSSEVRHLIRALFQNTNRRAAVLAKIN